MDSMGLSSKAAIWVCKRLLEKVLLLPCCQNAHTTPFMLWHPIMPQSQEEPFQSEGAVT